jgi:16S rRNA (cytosine1402-N4)-methyltransferase
MTHKSVLLHEAIDGLSIKKGDIVVDGTLGGGGHTEEIALKFGDKVTIVGLDLDHDALVRSRQRLAEKKLDIHYVESSFRRIDSVLKNLGFNFADKILLDIGLSSNQFEESGRGFSFQKNEPLIMSFKKNVDVDDLTAREIVNTWDLENIAAVIEGYGEESFAWKIAKAIVARREIKPIETTAELVEIIKVATPKWYHHRKIHPATKTFQALRITVNDEIRSLEEGMQKGWEILNKKGRMAIISFHSIEDRKVKQFFRKLDKEEVGKLINKKPITPKESEIKENPRSRSAKLRIIEKK